ncbi:MAG: hypothetical protein CR975_07130 [Gammaproteobacteria bacterium]|nr:MAG: hypothetical protein CR975_07130 [Gammaproteobacteria bacterium]
MQLTKKFIRNVVIGLAPIIALIMLGSGYNTLQTQDEAVTAGWSEVVNQYQRRADLIPNLVEVTKKYAAHEKAVFSDVANARSSAGSIQVTPEMLDDPAALKKFQTAQAQMGSALSRLLAVAENYPNLKADRIFTDLTAQLESTENRITVARNRYIKAVQAFNGTVRKFPTNITAKIFALQRKANFSVANETRISTAPAVNMD